MTEAQMREAVSAVFVAGWTATPFTLDNEAIDMGSSSFASLTITPTTSSQMTMGARGTRRTRRDGWITVKLWVTADTGATGMAALKGAVRNLLEMISIPSPLASDEQITTLAGSDTPVGVDGRWYMELVRLPFWYSETK
jgi:hypothetical protein